VMTRSPVPTGFWEKYSSQDSSPLKRKTCPSRYSNWGPSTNPMSIAAAGKSHSRMAKPTSPMTMATERSKERLRLMKAPSRESSKMKPMNNGLGIRINVPKRRTVRMADGISMRLAMTNVIKEA